MTSLTKAEFLKLRTHPLTALGLLGILLGVPALTLAIQLAAQGPPTEPLSHLSRSLQVNQLFVVITAASIFGTEYEGSCLRTTFLSHPQRLEVAASKLFVTLTSLFVCGLFAFLSGLAIVAFGSPQPGLLNEVFDTVWQALLSWFGFGLLASAISVITRSPIVPIAIFAPLIIGLSQLLMTFISYAAYLPDLATFQAFVQTDSPDLLTLWPGFGVQLLWAVTFIGPAIAIIQRSDVR